MKKSHAPVFWLLFGAGGMLAALFGVGMVWLTGLAGPRGWSTAPDLLDYDRLIAWLAHWPAMLGLWAFVALLAWHGVHRILCSLHDVGIPKDLKAKVLGYGLAAAVSLWSAWSLLQVPHS